MQFEATPQASSTGLVRAALSALTAFRRCLYWCGIYPVVSWGFSDLVNAITARR